MIQWTLYYDRNVITYLYKLRESGRDLRAQISSLKREPLPDSAIVLSEQKRIYLLVTEQHYITYKLKDEDKSIQILDIGPEDSIS